MEWPELTLSKKFKYFFPTMVLGSSIAAVMMALIAFFVFRDEPAAASVMAASLLLIIMLPWVPYFILQSRRIAASKARFARRSAFGDTDEFILSTRI